VGDREERALPVQRGDAAAGGAVQHDQSEGGDRQQDQQQPGIDMNALQQAAAAHQRRRATGHLPGKITVSHQSSPPGTNAGGTSPGSVSLGSSGVPSSSAGGALTGAGAAMALA